MAGGWETTWRKDQLCSSYSCYSSGVSFWSLLQTGYWATCTPKTWNNNTVLIFLFELWANCIPVFWCVDEFKVFPRPICAWAGGESSGATVPLGSRWFHQLHQGSRYEVHGETQEQSSVARAALHDSVFCLGSSKLQAMLCEAMCYSAHIYLHQDVFLTLLN